jgi:hypothetical protein
MRIKHNNKVWGLLATLLLTSCSSANVSGEWDCPRQKGHGCINIEQADAMALQKLDVRNQKAIELPVKYVSGSMQEIWFAPHIDEHGHLHEASIIKYRLEEAP